MALMALVPAAGGGTRFGGELPKQYVHVAGMPLLARTVKRLLELPELAAVYVAVHPDDEQHGDVLAPFGARVHALRCGGPTRAATVRNAVEALVSAHEGSDWLLVHDAARPCVPVTALKALVGALHEEEGGALLAIPVADTLKRSTAGGTRGERVLRTEDRTGLWQAQTPQAFRLATLRRALALPDAHHATDEAQAIEMLVAREGGAMPRLVSGSALNLKVTYPADIALAAAIIALQEQPAS